jgi:nucleotide-binding universal stress UspA family protein
LRYLILLPCTEGLNEATMFDQVIVCLDGSSLGEKIIPLGRGLTRATAGKLIFLRVVQDPAEISTEEDYLKQCARHYGAELRFVVSPDPAEAIITELNREPRATAALTTHGRTAWAEAIMGSVALRILRKATGPVLLFRPQNQNEAPKKITTVAAALDGSAFSEKILPYAVRAAQALSARLLLLQVLPVHAPQPLLSPREEIVESAYLHRKAAEIQRAHGIEPQWEVLHGDPADALCHYLKDMPETLLTMTSHARDPAKRAIVGSIAASCVRRVGLPLLLYWPPHRS